MRDLIERLEDGTEIAEGETVKEAVKGLKAGMHLLRERADYLWDILEKDENFDVRRRMGRLIENIKHTEESVYGFIDTFDLEEAKINDIGLVIDQSGDEKMAGVDIMVGKKKFANEFFDALVSWLKSKGKAGFTPKGKGHFRSLGPHTSVKSMREAAKLYREFAVMKGYMKKGKKSKPKPQYRDLWGR
jgi:hypothetical protein